MRKKRAGKLLDGLKVSIRNPSCYRLRIVGQRAAMGWILTW